MSFLTEKFAELDKKAILERKKNSENVDGELLIIQRPARISWWHKFKQAFNRSEMKEENIPITPKYQIGDFVRIVDHEKCYNTALNFFDKYLPNRACNFKMGFLPANGSWGVILKTFNLKRNATVNYFIELNLDCVVIVDEDGLRAINDQTLTLLKTRKREDG